MKISGIKLLTNFEGQDPIAEVLRSVNLRTVVFGRAVLREPWGLGVDLPGRAVFHIVLRGQCWLSVNGGSPTQLTCGDTAVFPRADAHEMTDRPGVTTRPITELLVRHPMTSDKRFCYGGSGALTVLLCGAFQVDHPKVNLLGVLLPRFLRIQNGRGGSSSQLRALTRCIETELKLSRPGGQAIVTRMAETFLLNAIRDFVLGAVDGEPGLPAVLRDQSIARTLGLIHQRPEHPWTVETLAKEAHLSRSAFAARFKLRVGDTSQNYLQRFRFSKAIQLLRTTDRKIEDIALHVGYESGQSFSKAFKRVIGASPSSFRQPS